MIKVVAFDLDGTLLNSSHKISEENLKMIERGTQAGLHFIVITGRSYQDAIKAVGEYNLPVDYIVASGAEIRDRNNQVLRRIPMDQSNFADIVRKIKKFPVAIRFCSDDYDYMLGSREEIRDYIVTEYQFFHSVLSKEEIIDSDDFRMRFERVRQLNSLFEMRQRGIDIFKIMVFSEDEFMIADIDDELLEFTNIASASSFANNLELTHYEAQKGIALRAFTEEHGYTMDEVMCIGDSMNDYSMLSMKFGATVAVENGMDKIKKVSRYITKSNDEDGVAWAIRHALGEYRL